MFPIFYCTIWCRKIKWYLECNSTGYQESCVTKLKTIVLEEKCEILLTIMTCNVQLKVTLTTKYSTKYSEKKWDT